MLHLCLQYYCCIAFYFYYFQSILVIAKYKDIIGNTFIFIHPHLLINFKGQKSNYLTRYFSIAYLCKYVQLFLLRWQTILGFNEFENIRQMQFMHLLIIKWTQHITQRKVTFAVLRGAKNDVTRYHLMAANSQRLVYIS